LDPDHSREEERLITIGAPNGGVFFFVAHTERADASESSAPGGDPPGAEQYEKTIGEETH